MSACRRVGAALLLFDATCEPQRRALQEAGLLRAAGRLAPPPLLTAAAEEDANVHCVESLLRSVPPTPLAPRTSPDGLCTLVFTSGSTGPPKACALTHAAFLAASAAKLDAVGYGEEDVYYHAAPLCHVGGLSSAHAVLLAGGQHCFPASGGWEARAAMRAMREQRCTALILVPTMLFDLVTAHASEAEGAAAALGHVKRVLLGGGAIPPTLLAAAAHLFPSATIIATYALSEACSSLAFRTLATHGRPTPPPPPDPLGGVCVGAPPPAMRLRIGAGHEICACGPQIMAGYYQNEGASAAVLVPDPPPSRLLWLRTGDLGRLDAAGQLWLLGRRAEVIKSGGESVHASEVEGALLTHPLIRAAAVVALPEPRWGEQVAALLHLAPGVCWEGPWVGQQGAGGGQALSPDGVREFLAAGPGLARFKMPRFLVACGGLPLGATGKVDKGAVQEALGGARASDGDGAALRSRL